MEGILKKDRVEWIDTAKFFGMFFIMIHHIGYIPEYISVVYSPFILPVFFFASGYVDKKSDFKTYIKKKSLTLLLPWAVYGLLMSVFAAASGGGISSLPGEIGRMFLQVRDYGDKLWFIPCLFVSSVIFFFIGKLKDRTSLIVSVCVALVGIFYSTYFPAVFPWGSNNLPWHINIAIVAQLFMIAGALFKGKAETFADKFAKVRFILPITVLYVVVIFLIRNFIGDFYSVQSFGTKPYSFILWFLIEALSLIVIIGISKIIKANKFTNFVGQNTLLYYVFHIDIERFLSTIFMRIFFGVANYDYYILIDYVVEKIFTPGTAICEAFYDVSKIVCAVFYVLMTMAVLIIPIILINKFLPFTLGRFKKKKPSGHINEKNA